jgi:hypothetical protein
VNGKTYIGSSVDLGRRLSEYYTPSGLNRGNMLFPIGFYPKKIEIIIIFVFIKSSKAILGLRPIFKKKKEFFYFIF